MPKAAGFERALLGDQSRLAFVQVRNRGDHELHDPAWVFFCKEVMARSEGDDLQVRHELLELL